MIVAVAYDADIILVKMSHCNLHTWRLCIVSIESCLFISNNVVMLHLAQAYWVTNSFDMNSFNVFFGKWDGLITRMVLRAKRGGPGLYIYAINLFKELKGASCNSLFCHFVITSLLLQRLFRDWIHAYTCKYNVYIIYTKTQHQLKGKVV